MSAELLRAYWDGFYASQASGAVPGDSSAFAQWVAGRVPPNATVAEFGFGTARDSFFFAERGNPVRGFDFSETAVARAQGRAHERGADALFEVLDLYDVDGTTAAAGHLAAEASLVVYGRFLLHSLEESGRANLLDLAATALDSGGELLLEFRTGQDAGHQHVFGEDHYRAYLDPDEVVAAIETRGGTIVHSEAGHGLAIYKSEDPHVARIVAVFD